MSTPYNGGGYEPYPEHPEGSHPENGTGNYPAYGTDNYGAGADAYDADAYDAFDVNTAAQAAGASALRFHGQQLTDNLPGDGVSPHPINDPASNGWYHVKGNGKLNVLEAIGWGVKATFSNGKLWIPLGIAYALLALAGQFLPGFGAVLSAVGSLLLAPWMAGVALQQTLTKRLTYNEAKAPAYGKTIGMAALLGFILTVVVTVLMFVFAFGALSTIDPSTLPDTGENVTAEEMWTIIRPILGALGVTFLVGLLASPFFTFQMWYAADNNGSFGHALGAGFKAGASNYLKILGFVVLIGLLNMVGAALFFIGMIVTLPAAMLSAAHAYRQISGGPVPKEAVATA